MRIVCIYHSIDLDGWMSAAIVKHWHKKYLSSIPDNFKKTCILDFIGYNYGDPIPNLINYDLIIMCDTSFSKREMEKLKDDCDINFVYIDHHISAMKDLGIDSKNSFTSKYDGIQNTSFAACELTWQYFFPDSPIPEIVRLLGRYDCFGHKGTHEELKVLEFQYGARQRISNYEEAYEWLTMCIDHLEITNEIQNAGSEIYQYLCTEAKQAYKNGFKIEFNYPVLDAQIYGSDYVKLEFICINKERFNPINFGIDYHEASYDGCACFHYANGMWNFSLYNDNGLVDCSAIAKQYGGGGHKGAAGFRIKDISTIIK